MPYTPMQYSPSPNSHITTEQVGQLIARSDQVSLEANSALNRIRSGGSANTQQNISLINQIQHFCNYLRERFLTRNVTLETVNPVELAGYEGRLNDFQEAIELIQISQHMPMDLVEVQPQLPFEARPNVALRPRSSANRLQMTSFQTLLATAPQMPELEDDTEVQMLRPRP